MCFDHSSFLKYAINTPVDVLITGSWDQTIRFWDPRSASPQQLSHNLPERVYHMDLMKNTLVVAMASRMFHIYDIRKMDAPAQQRESSLKFMTRSLACMVDGQGECRRRFNHELTERDVFVSLQVTRQLRRRAE